MGIRAVSSAPSLGLSDTILSGLACFFKFFFYFCPTTPASCGVLRGPSSAPFSTSTVPLMRVLLHPWLQLASVSDDSHTYIRSQIVPEIWIQRSNGSGFPTEYSMGNSTSSNFFCNPDLTLPLHLITHLGSVDFI